MFINIEVRKLPFAKKLANAPLPDNITTCKTGINELRDNITVNNNESLYLLILFRFLYFKLFIPIRNRYDSLSPPYLASRFKRDALALCKHWLALGYSSNTPVNTTTSTILLVPASWLIAQT